MTDGRSAAIQIDSTEIERADSPAIEVAVLFEEAVLSVAYVSAEESFAIGSARDACAVPEATLPFERFPLVRGTGRAGDFELLFTGTMAGELTQGGTTCTLAALAASGRARPEPELSAHAVLLSPGARARIELGAITLLVSQVAAPRKQPVPFRFEWRRHASTIAVAVAAAIFLVLSASVPPDPHALATDDLSLLHRPPLFVDIAQLLDDAPKTPANEGASAGQDRAGGRARGESGRMGRPTAPAVRRRYALKGPASNHDIQLGRAAAERAARDAGILGTLRATSQIGSIFSRDGSALGADAETAMGGLIGTEIGDSWGVPDGLGVFGDRKGGGGTQDTIGLTNLPTIGRSGLRPDGSYGARVGTLRPRGHRPLVIGPVPGEVHVKGGIDKEIVRRVVREHLAEVRFCYERELQRRADLGGRVVSQFLISGKGQVVSAAIASSTMNDAAVESCISQAVRRWSFPAPEGGGVVMVSYPFVLRSAGQ